MHNLGGHWQLGPDVCMWRSSFEQNLSPGFQFAFEICFKFKVCRTKGKTCLMLWQSHSIVSGLILAFRTSYSFRSSWLSVALNKSGRQKLSAEGYFILLHTIPCGTSQYFIPAFVGLSFGYSPQQVQLVLVHHHQVSQYETKMQGHFFTEVLHLTHFVIKPLHCLMMPAKWIALISLNSFLTH